MTTKVPLRGLKGRLVNSSIDAYVLALETINRISVRYRVEAFTMLIVNAWELLIKARIIHVAGSNDAIYSNTDRRQPHRSLDVRGCVRRVYPDENDLKRKNLEFIIRERDKAVHLVIDRIPKEMLAVFQSSVVNYHHELLDWFGVSLSDRVPVGMMSLVYDLGPEQFDLSNKILRRRLGAEAVAYMAERQGEIRRLQEQFGYAQEFASEVQFNVTVTNNPRGGDVVLRGGTGGRETGVLDKPRDAANTHPYRAAQVVGVINLALADRHRITSHDLVCVRQAHNIQANPAYFFQSNISGSFPQYSDQFVAWVVERFNGDTDFFADCRVAYRNSIRSRKLHSAKANE